MREQIRPKSKLGSYAPRGHRRVIYVSDPSSIARHYLPDPVSESDLRNWVDELARAEVDTFIQEAYTQGWTTYWRSDPFEYDARPQHRRFLPLLDAGIQPLGVLFDQSHERGMEFMAGIRMNDNHGHVSVGQGAGAGASFIVDNPQWQLKEAPAGPYFKLSTSMDFTFPEVRDYLFSVTEKLVDTFDVDGLELCFRDQRYFPPGKERECQRLMTGLVGNIHDMLQRKAVARGKKMLLGARVYETLEECHDQGLDVPTWISEGLVDYVAPSEVMHSTPNATYEEFAELTRSNGCMLYPGMLPHTSIRMRRRGGGMPISLDQQRAVARNCYGAGADGISIYNHFVPLKWAPFYPMMLQDLVEVRDPERVSRGNRHYVFEPTLAGGMGFGEGRASTGALKADRIILNRSTPGASGRYRFRMCEDVGEVRRASLLFRGYHTTSNDQLEVRLNDTRIPAQSLRRLSDESRLDMAAVVDPDSTAGSGLPPVPELPGPFSTFWFELHAPPAAYGDNWLEVTLTAGDPSATQDIFIDEIEVHVAV